MQSWRLEHVGPTGPRWLSAKCSGAARAAGRRCSATQRRQSSPLLPPVVAGVRARARASARPCARARVLVSCVPPACARGRALRARAGPRRDVALTLRTRLRAKLRSRVRTRAYARASARTCARSWFPCSPCVRARVRACLRARADVRCVRACEHLWNPKPPVVQAPVEPEDPVRVHLLSDVIPQHSARIAQATHQQHADRAANPQGAARGPVPR